MAILVLDPGSAATYGAHFPALIEGTVSSANDVLLDGSRAYKFTSGASGEISAITYGDGSLTTAGCVSAFVYLENIPTAVSTLFQAQRIAGGNVWRLRSSATGVLQMWNNSAQIGSNGSTLSINTTYRITICYSVTSTTVNEFRVYLQPLGGSATLDISISNATLTYATPDRLRIGIPTDAAGNNHVRRFAHIYVDDNNSLNDPGNIHTTAKQATGLNTNNFDTLGGSGTNRWDRISERPLSETNYIQHAASSDVQENYSIQSAAQGDVNLTGATIVGYGGWVWAKNTESPQFVRSFKNTNKTTGTTLAITVSSAAVGNTYLIAFSMDGATGTISCTDNASTPNTYTVDVDKAAASPGATNVRTAIIRAYIANATNLTTITITHPSVTARAAVVCEFFGINQSTPLDKSTSDVNSGTGASSGATATTSQANEIIFGAIGAEEEAGTFTAGSGMTPDQSVADTATTTGGGSTSNVAVQAQYAIQTATATHTADATIANTDWAACIATYTVLNTGTPKIMVDGVETSLLLTSTPAVYFSPYTTSATYPANAAGIGMRSTNATSDTYFYEGGILIAYIPGSPQLFVGSLSMLGVGR